jgi:hypothetical protein
MRRVFDVWLFLDGTDYMFDDNTRELGLGLLGNGFHSFLFRGFNPSKDASHVGEKRYING